MGEEHEHQTLLKCDERMAEIWKATNRIPTWASVAAMVLVFCGGVYGWLGSNALSDLKDHGQRLPVVEKRYEDVRADMKEVKDTLNKNSDKLDRVLMLHDRERAAVK